MSDHASTSICYFDGQWGSGAVPLMTSTPTPPGSPTPSSTAPARSRASRPISTCTASGRSGRPQGLHLQPTITAEQIDALAREGIAQVSGTTRRSTSARCSGPRAGWCCPIPASTQFALVHHQDAACPIRPRASRRACRPTGGRAPSRRRRTPRRRVCIRWPAWRSPRRSERGFDNAVMCDPIGNVAELTAQNIMFVKDGVVPHADPERHVPERHHPAAGDRAAARRRRRRWSSGPSARTSCSTPTRSSRPATTARSCRACATSRGRSRPGPIYRKARELYWAFAHSRVAAPAAAR